ncbi:hypothetical protein TNCV_4005421 [Trichonephila clavipes]|nr:hypothetical protein TNCV_4005421 [Trichonephila clavipes]
MVHPPYSPDVNLCNFDLFPKLKEPLLGHLFHDISSLRRSLGCSVADINIEHLNNGFQRLSEEGTRAKLKPPDSFVCPRLAECENFARFYKLISLVREATSWWESSHGFYKGEHFTLQNQKENSIFFETEREHRYLSQEAFCHCSYYGA